MADLMIGDDLLLLRRDDSPFLLFTGDNGLHTLLDILRRHGFLTETDGTEGSLVDDIGDIGATGTGGGTAYGIHINVGMLDMTEMNLKDGLTTFEVREFHDDTTVETTRTQQGLIQTLGSVRGGKDDDTLRGIEAIHLREQLVQRLFTLIIAHGRVTALADGINLIYEDDTRCLLRSLTEEVTDFRGTHTDKHLYELRTTDGEERHMSLRLILSGDIGEARLHIALGIDLRSRLADGEETTAATEAAFHHLVRSGTPDPPEDESRENPPYEEVDKR